jgi:hypothetical protein
MTLDASTYTLRNGGEFGKRSLWIGAGGLALSAVGFAVNPERFFHSYLVAYMLWVAVGLGALFLVMLHYLVNARWSIVIRRLLESVMATLPAMAILFLPIVLGLHQLYPWSDASAVAKDALLAKKASYLNSTFFLVRALVYFGIWYLLSRSLYRASIAEDTAYDEARRARTRRVAAGGMLLFAFTSTFAAFDWLMSLDPHWYSTIYGAYVFAGAVLSILSFTMLVALHLHRKGILVDVIGVEHYNDLGKLSFAFVIFWAYMAFSQYLIIWYGNIPEETIWYAHRWVGSWKFVSLFLVIGRFALPFVLLMPKTIKRNLRFLGVISIWMLLMQWVDLYWLVVPEQSPEGAGLSWIDPVTMAGVGGIFVWLFWRRFASAPLIPIGDPRLEGSLQSLSM